MSKALTLSACLALLAFVLPPIGEPALAAASEAAPSISEPAAAAPAGAAPPAAAPPGVAPPGAAPPGAAPHISEPAAAVPPEVRIIPTAYDIPAGALFVSAAAGSDTNPGTPAQPLRTAAEAIRRAPSGTLTTIVFRQGEYREAPGDLHKPVSLQPYPGEAVWFKGSTVVPASQFVTDASAWRLDNWNPAICWPGADGRACVHPPDIVNDNPLAGDPEMVFRNETPMTQVASRDQLAAGRFFWDSVNSKLFLGTDPAGAVIETASRAWAMHLHAGAAGSMIRGLGFAHWATSQDYRKRPGALIVQAPGVVLENNTVAHNAAAGLVLNAHDAPRDRKPFRRKRFQRHEHASVRQSGVRVQSRVWKQRRAVRSPFGLQPGGRGREGDVPPRRDRARQRLRQQSGDRFLVRSVVLSRHAGAQCGPGQRETRAILRDLVGRAHRVQPFGGQRVLRPEGERVQSRAGIQQHAGGRRAGDPGSPRIRGPT